MSAEINFDGYLRSLVSKYEQDQHTHTDAISLFDSGLMLQVGASQFGLSINT